MGACMEAAYQRVQELCMRPWLLRNLPQTHAEWLLQVSLATVPLPSGARALVLGEGECALVNTVRERKKLKG